MATGKTGMADSGKGLVRRRAAPSGGNDSPQPAAAMDEPPSAEARPSHRARAHCAAGSLARARDLVRKILSLGQIGLSVARGDGPPLDQEFFERSQVLARIGLEFPGRSEPH